MSQHARYQWVRLPDGTEVKVDIQQMVAKVSTLWPKANALDRKQRGALLDGDVRTIGDALKRPLKDIHSDMASERGTVQANRVMGILKKELRDFGFDPEARR